LFYRLSGNDRFTFSVIATFHRIGKLEISVRFLSSIPPVPVIPFNAVVSYKRRFLSSDIINE